MNCLCAGTAQTYSGILCGHLWIVSSLCLDTLRDMAYMELISME